MSHRDDVRFAFLDIETTGLDRDLNYILEIGWVFTDAYFQQISEPKSFLVDHDGSWGSVIRQIEESEFLTNMHTESGLYQDILDERVEKTAMVDILSAFVDDAVDNGAPTIPFRFAGYSVSFDREFLRSNGWHSLIETDALGFQMHHRILDISSLLQFFDGIGLQVPYIDNANAHRAINDSIHAMKTVQSMALDMGLTE